MRHMPNDIITVTNPDNSGAYLYGDSFAMYGSDWGGNDILTAINSGFNSFAFLYGDGFYMYDSTHGGNDILTTVNSAESTSSNLFGKLGTCPEVRRVGMIS